MRDNNAHVVIVGINHYDDDDISDLRGARNDAIAWWRLCTGYLNVPPAHISVLASPPLTAAELGPGAEASRLAGASRSEIVEAMNQLAAVVAESRIAGLVTFSGHGVAAGPKRTGDEGEDLALCPSDVSLSEERVDNLVRFSRLSKLFAAENVRDNVTVILDCCYTETTADSGPNRGLLGALRDKKAGRRLHDAMANSKLGRVALVMSSITSLSTRLILGSEHWATAYEIRIGNDWRGACSWAFCTLMEQWARRSQDGAVYLNVSYRQLIQHATSLLAAIGVQQVPVLWGLRRLDNLPVMRPGLDYTPGETSAQPDGVRGGKQIPVDVGHYVTVAHLTSESDFALVVAVGNVGFTLTDAAGNTFTYQRDTEYWYANENVDLSGIDSWSEMSWRCHFSGSYEDAGDSVADALVEFDKQASQVAWTASRTAYTWAPGAASLGYSSYGSFTNGDSGVVVGLNSNDELTGVVIYNGDNTITWPDSSETMVEGQDVAFSSSSVGDLPDYHYKFVT